MIGCKLLIGFFLIFTGFKITLKQSEICKPAAKTFYSLLILSYIIEHFKIFNEHHGVCDCVL